MAWSKQSVAEWARKHRRRNPYDPSVPETPGEAHARFLMENSRLVLGSAGPSVKRLRGSTRLTAYALWKRLGQILDRDPSLEDCEVRLVEDDSILCDEDAVIEIDPGTPLEDPPTVIIRFEP